MLRLIGLLLLIPLLDALLLVVLVPFLGWQLVVLLVVLTALLGLLFVRMAGRHTIRKIQRRVARGESPTDELLDGALLLVAAAFFLTPGLVTDALAFLIVVPLTRYPIRWMAKRYVVTPYLDKKTGGFATGNVYIGGFPDEDDFDGRPGQGTGPGGPDSGPDDSPPGGPDRGPVQDVDFEEVDKENRGSRPRSGSEE